MIKLGYMPAINRVQITICGVLMTEHTVVAAVLLRKSKAGPIASGIVLCVNPLMASRVAKLKAPCGRDSKNCAPAPLVSSLNVSFSICSDDTHR